MKLISVRSSLERISSIICIFCEKKHIKSEQMLVQTNLQRLADDNYNSYYDPYNVYDNSYSYTMDYIIYGSIAGAIIFGAALFFYFMIKRRRNRLRRAQLTSKNSTNIACRCWLQFYRFNLQMFLWPQIDSNQELVPNNKHHIWQQVKGFHLQLMLTIHHKDNQCKTVYFKIFCVSHFAFQINIKNNHHIINWWLLIFHFLFVLRSYGNFAQPGVMTAAGGYQYQPSNQQGTSGPVQHTPYQSFRAQTIYRYYNNLR